MMSLCAKRRWHVPAMGVVLLTVLCLSGCGRGQPVYPVHGQIVYSDGSPATDLAGFTVTFESVEQGATSEQAGIGGWGIVQPDGTFTIGTFRPNDGALPGRHRVAISPEPDLSDEAAPTEPPISLQYAAIETSGLECEVTPGRNEIVLTVERR